MKTIRLGVGTDWEGHIGEKVKIISLCRDDYYWSDRKMIEGKMGVTIGDFEIRIGERQYPLLYGTTYQFVPTKIVYSDKDMHSIWKNIVRRAIRKGNFHVGDLVHTVEGRKGQPKTDGYIVSFGIRFGPLLKNPHESFNKYPFALVSKRGYVKNECARIRAYMLKNLRHGAVPREKT